MDSDLHFIYAVALAFETIIFSWFQERQVPLAIKRCKKLLKDIKRSQMSDSRRYIFIKKRLRKNSKKLKKLETVNKVSLIIAKTLATIVFFLLMLGAWGGHLVSKAIVPILSSIQSLSWSNILKIICVKCEMLFASSQFFCGVLFFILIQSVLLLCTMARVDIISRYTEYDADVLKAVKRADKKIGDISCRTEDRDDFSKP